MRILLISTLLVLTACTQTERTEVTKASPLDPTRLVDLPAMRSFSMQTVSAPTRSNADIAADFMDLEFSLESGRRLPVLTRFDGPVTVAMQGDVPPTAPADLGQVMGRLRSEAGIDVSFASAANASIHIEFLPRKRMQAIVPTAACFVAPRVTSWAEYRKSRKSGVLDWTTLTRREHLAIFVPSDTSPQEVRDCLHEELAQALGPLNDLYRLPDSVFNDDNFQAVLTGFDMLILRMHYSSELQNGMTAADVKSRVPALLARLNPEGEFGGLGSFDATPRLWIDQIEAALGPKGVDGARLRAAEKALGLAKAEGWADNRLAFSYFAVGRLNLSHDLPRAVASFTKAAQLYRTLPDGAVHTAHVDMQMAAFALSSGQPDATLALANAAIPVAMRAQNAALLATFMLLKAQALDQLGRAYEAQAVRLDSLGWARYGFGSDQDVRKRIADIAALLPRQIGG